MRAQFRGFFHKKAAPHCLAEGQSHNGKRCGAGSKGFLQAFQTHIFFAHRADDKVACAAPPVQQANRIARFEAQRLPQMSGLLTFQTGLAPPGLGRQIKKGFAHATVTSFISLLSAPRRALRAALKPSCRETSLP